VRLWAEIKDPLDEMLVMSNIMREDQSRVSWEK
jgi:hypothetical protein